MLPKGSAAHGDMLVKPTVLLVVTLDYRRCPIPGVSTLCGSVPWQVNGYFHLHGYRAIPE
jgi:hypothetical protein